MVRGEGGQDFAGDVGCGNEVAAFVLRQRPNIGGDEFFAQPGDLPAELVRVDRGHRLGGDLHGHPILGAAGVEGIAQLRHGAVAQFPFHREVRGHRGGQYLTVVAEQHRGGEVEQMRVPSLLLLPPTPEIRRRGDPFRNPLIEEFKQGIVLVEHATVPRP